MQPVILKAVVLALKVMVLTLKEAAAHVKMAVAFAVKMRPLVINALVDTLISWGMVRANNAT